MSFAVENQPPIEVAPEVEAALEAGDPVLALESTIIAHGLPRPDNLEVARHLEEILRSSGVTPATIAVVEGVVRVGLSEAELEGMATWSDVGKATLRDLPLLAAGGGTAATTVAATAWLAQRCGIRVFATGGLGGVHRGDANDVSADLTVLSTTPITIVCSGIKSVLDVAASLERLETLGVSVVGYQTDRFPGFYVADSGYPIEWRLDDPEAIVRAMRAADKLGIPGALIVANPVPAEAQLDPELHDRVVTDALAAGEKEGISGKDVTPHLLAYLNQNTGGKALRANVAAVINNVSLAGQIALHWSASAG